MTDDELDAVHVLSSDLSAIAAGAARYFVEDRACDSMRRPWKDLSPRQSAFLWQLVYQHRGLYYMPHRLVDIARQRLFGSSKRDPPPTHCGKSSSRFG